MDGQEHAFSIPTSRRGILQLLQGGNLSVGVLGNLLQFARSLRLYFPKLLPGGLLGGLGLTGLRLDETLLGIVHPGFHFIHCLLELGQRSIAQNLRARLQRNRIKVGNRFPDCIQAGGVGPGQWLRPRFGPGGTDNGAGQVRFQGLLPLRREPRQRFLLTVAHHRDSQETSCRPCRY